MPADAATETKADFAARLARAVETDLGSDALPNPEGWRVGGVALKACRGGDNRVEADIDPVVRFELPEHVLFLAVMARDDEKPAYRRTERYDLIYFSDDAAASQQTIFDRDRETIDRFGNWVEQWEKGSAAQGG